MTYNPDISGEKVMKTSMIASLFTGMKQAVQDRLGSYFHHDFSTGKTIMSSRSGDVESYISIGGQTWLDPYFNGSMNMYDDGKQFAQSNGIINAIGDEMVIEPSPDVQVKCFPAYDDFSDEGDNIYAYELPAPAYNYADPQGPVWGPVGDDQLFKILVTVNGVETENYTVTNLWDDPSMFTTIHLDLERKMVGDDKIVIKYMAYNSFGCFGMIASYYPETCLVEGGAFVHGGENLEAAWGAYAGGRDAHAYGSCSHAEGESAWSTAEWAHAEGYSVHAEGLASHAEGRSTEAAGKQAHAEGYQSQATGDYSHAESSKSKAIGTSSHAEGDQTTARGAASHVEGYRSSTEQASDYAHAEGYFTKADGIASHAEGYATQALGSYSHAEGRSTVAHAQYQSVFGAYNTIDSNDLGYLELAGNGVGDNTRSCARTLDRDGNECLDGTLWLGGCFIDGDTPYSAVRYNTSTGDLEYWDTTSWTAIGGGNQA